MEQIWQVGGAILILVAFAGAQVRRMSTASIVYLGLNLAGSSVLAVVAWLDRDWGFVLLETVWAAVSLYGLVRRQPSGAPT